MPALDPVAAQAGTFFLLAVKCAQLAALLAVGAALGVWAVRRRDAGTAGLVKARTRSTADGNLPAPPSGGSVLARSIQALLTGVQQSQLVHGFVRDTLDCLPDAMLVCNCAGTVLLANAAAARHFQVATDRQLQGQTLPGLMRDVLTTTGQRPVLDAAILALTPPRAVTALACHGQDRELLVKLAPSFSTQGVHTGWILLLVDVTQMQQVQHQRDAAVRFLGHDLRAPQASIIALLTLYRQDPGIMSAEQIHARIAHHARKGLRLSDDFIHWMRAESQSYYFERCNLLDVLTECIDDAWESSQRRRIQVVTAASAQDAESLIDRQLVARAIGNLLDNALKFSPTATVVTCAVQAHADGWAVRVQDQGPGIAQAAQDEMFKPFTRNRVGGPTDGAGLGLAFVKTVAQRHGGQVTLDSAPGCGSAFSLIFPKASPADDVAATAGAASASRPIASLHPL